MNQEMKIFVFFVLHLVLPLCFSEDAVERIIEKDSECCEDVCEKTYPLHTYPTAEHLSCCRRGCRFFSMIDVLGTNEDKNKTLESCLASCTEAYNLTSVNLGKQACNSGCESQMAFAVKSKENQQPKTAHMLQPLMYVQAFYTNVVGQVSGFISTTWTLYVQEDTGKIIMSKSSPDIAVMQDLISVNGDSDLDKNLVLNDGFAEATLQREEFIRVQETVDRPRMDWLSCVSRETGSQRIIVLAILFMGIMVALWLCCATAAVSPEKKLKLRVLGQISPPPYEEKQLLLLNDEFECEKKIPI